ncbi:DUF11 domain-containing protein, partial [Candidatus Saccharibacteria bacterium]|nr:DUF11 domain-containing protein [Candidatus Saccharibacteria bacterium]
AKTITQKLKNHKIAKVATSVALALVATIAGAGLIKAESANAWGPDTRTTYTNASPAPYATFNSITDNAAVGDERNFVRVKEAGTTNTYTDEVEVVPGKEYEVYIYYHNDAASNTNSSGYGIATDTRVSSAYPTLLNSGERGMISGIISWSYVTPAAPNDAKDATVWDEAYLTTQSNNVVLRYKTGTATIHNAGQTNGSVLSTNLFTTNGTPIGFNKLTGILPGCADYSGYITYTLVAESTSSELTKEVSLDGTNWSSAATVNPGDYVTYRVTFKNTGNTTLTNVIFKDAHSDELSLRSGSTQVFDVNNPNGTTIADIIDISGYNVGDVVPGAEVRIIYQALAGKPSAGCNQILSNVVSVEYNGVSQQTSATNVTYICSGENVPSVAGDTSCAIDSSLPGCTELPDTIVSTGPAEVAMAVAIVLAIAGAGFYLWVSQRELRLVQGRVSGKSKSTRKVAAKSTKSARSAKKTTRKRK